MRMKNGLNWGKIKFVGQIEFSWHDDNEACNKESLTSDDKMCVVSTVIVLLF